MNGVFKLYGIRSPAAKKNIAQMQQGDTAVWYSSSAGRYAFGIMEVKCGPYPDPTSKKGWLSIDFAPIKTFKTKIPYNKFKENDILKQSNIVRQKRISVVAITKEEYEEIKRIDENISKKGGV